MNRYKLDPVICQVCGLSYEGHPTCHLCGGLSGERHETHIISTVRGHPVCKNCSDWAASNPSKVDHFLKVHGKERAVGIDEEEL